MTKVLVSAGSKHGSTSEIADRIGAVIAERGIAVDVKAPATVESVAGYSAFVIGSAVYAGHWTKDVQGLVHRFGPALSHHPVWLFSSGPIGDPPKPDEEPVDVAEMTIETMSREHRIFPGRLDKDKLSFPERAIVTAFRAPYGDYRDWAAIEAWAKGIADEVAASG